MHHFHANLKAVREYRGFTQADMANHLIMPRSTYASYETGASEPSLRALWHIQHKLNVGIDALLNATFYKYDSAAMADALAVAYPRPNVQLTIPAHVD